MTKAFKARFCLSYLVKYVVSQTYLIFNKIIFNFCLIHLISFLEFDTTFLFCSLAKVFKTLARKLKTPTLASLRSYLHISESNSKHTVVDSRYTQIHTRIARRHNVKIVTKGAWSKFESTYSILSRPGWNYSRLPP